MKVSEGSLGISWRKGDTFEASVEVNKVKEEARFSFLAISHFTKISAP